MAAIGRYLSKVCSWLDKIALYLAAAILAAMCAIVVIELVGRYMFNYSFTWIEELARYLLVWLTFVVASSAIWRAELIGITYVVNKLPRLGRKLVTRLSSILMAGFLVLLFYEGLTFVEMGQALMSPALRVPMSWVYLAIPVGAVLMFIQTLGVLFSSADRLAEAMPLSAETKSRV